METDISDCIVTPVHPYPPHSRCLVADVGASKSVNRAHCPAARVFMALLSNSSQNMETSTVGDAPFREHRRDFHRLVTGCGSCWDNSPLSTHCRVQAYWPGSARTTDVSDVGSSADVIVRLLRGSKPRMELANLKLLFLERNLWSFSNHSTVLKKCLIQNKVS